MKEEKKDKIYRLKKDSLAFKAGTLFELRPGRNANDNVLFKKGTDIALSLDGGDTALQELIAEDSGWFEEVKADECWVPAYGEGYWYIADTDGVGTTVWTGHRTIDKYRLAIGNVFRTKEDAEKALEWLKARKILFDDAKGFKPNWSNISQDKYAVTFSTREALPCVEYTSGIFLMHCGPYFATREDAEASVKAHKKEWMIYLGVEK